MKSKHLFCISLLILFSHTHTHTAFAQGISEQAGEDAIKSVVSAHIPKGAMPTIIETKTVNGRTYTFSKYVDDKGISGETILDSEGNIIEEEDLPTTKPEIIRGSLKAILERAPSHPLYVPDDKEIAVDISLKEDEINEPADPPSFSTASEQNGIYQITINGNIVTEEELNAYQEDQYDRIILRMRAREEQARVRILELIRRNPELDQPTVLNALERGDRTITAKIKKGRILSFIDLNKDYITTLEQYVKPVNESLATAMRSTRIDPYAFTGNKGSGVGIYMTETPCPFSNTPSLYPPYYYNISGDDTTASSEDFDHGTNVGSIIRAVSSMSDIYCRKNFTLPTSTDLLGYYGRDKVYIQNHSHGIPISPTDPNNDYTKNDKAYDDHVYDTRMAVFKSAGNYGYTHGYISVPGRAFNVITIGSYNEYVNTNDIDDRVNTFSSYVDPATNNEKPEICAPGTNIDAGGYTLTGTSMAAPHAAGFAADLMSTFTWLKLRPYALKAQMIASARNIFYTFQDKEGEGAINYQDAYYNWTGYALEDINFNTYAYDAYPNNGAFEIETYLNQGQYTSVALSWLNRGEYIEPHRLDAHPIGIDLDLYIYDPLLHVIYSSTSYDNPYEIIRFFPPVTGKYTIQVQKRSQRDTVAKIYMGLAIDH